MDERGLGLGFTKDHGECLRYVCGLRWCGWRWWRVSRGLGPGSGGWGGVMSV